MRFSLLSWKMWPCLVRVHTVWLDEDSRQGLAAVTRSSGSHSFPLYPHLLPLFVSWIQLIIHLSWAMRSVLEMLLHSQWLLRLYWNHVLAWTELPLFRENHSPMMFMIVWRTGSLHTRQLTFLLIWGIRACYVELASNYLPASASRMVGLEVYATYTWLHWILLIACWLNT